jgi:hypothetical protein
MGRDIDGYVLLDRERGRNGDEGIHIVVVVFLDSAREVELAATNRPPEQEIRSSFARTRNGGSSLGHGRRAWTAPLTIANPSSEPNGRPAAR